MNSLQEEIKDLQGKRDACFKEFDSDIPRVIKEMRVNRMQMQNSKMGKGTGKKAGEFSTSSNAPSDMYYMLHVNSKYRKRIHKMLKDLRVINQKRRDLEDEYAPLKKDLATVKKSTHKYKAVKGDEIDRLMMEALHRAELELSVKRLAEGKYLFGTR